MLEKCCLSKNMLSKIEKALQQEDIQKAIMMSYMCGAFNSASNHGYLSIFDGFGIWEEENLSKESSKIIFDCNCEESEGPLCDNEEAIKKLILSFNDFVFNKMWMEKSPEFY